jgi:hypothetical protein
VLCYWPRPNFAPSPEDAPVLTLSNLLLLAIVAVGLAGCSLAGTKLTDP